MTGVETEGGPIHADAVVIAAGAWAAGLAATAGVEIPVQPWRHDTAYFGLPEGHSTGDFPIVLDDIAGVYFRPEGSELMLVGLEGANEIGGSPDRPLAGLHGGAIETMIGLVVRRLPWMAAGTLRTTHGGQDGITPDQRAIIGTAGAEGPAGLYLLCGFSGTGFKTAPAIGLAMAELILDGRFATIDLAPFALRRFAEGRPLVGEHPYGMLWRED